MPSGSHVSINESSVINSGTCPSNRRSAKEMDEFRAGETMEERIGSAEADQTIDISLAERIREADEAAVEQAYSIYFDKVANFVYFTTYDYEAAKDISQDAFLKVVKATQDPEKQVRDFRSYLFQTAKNMAMDEMRRRKRTADFDMAETEEDPGIFADPERASLLSEQRRMVRNASMRLNEYQRMALTLREIDGLSYSQIGSVLEISTGAVGLLLTRARLKFRREYRMELIDEEKISPACRNFLNLYSAKLDGETSPEEDAAIEEHLTACPECRSLMGELVGASTDYRSLIPLAPLLVLKAGVIANAIGLLGAAGGAAAAAGAGAGMSAAMKAIVGVTTALLVAGAGVGTYVGVKKMGSGPAKAPYVRVVTPAQGENLTRARDKDGKARVLVLMEVDNAPSKVELSIDGKLAVSLDKGPYRYAWLTDQGGGHTVEPAAFDKDGKKYSGVKVAFTLDLGKPPRTAEGLVYLVGGNLYLTEVNGTGREPLTKNADAVTLAVSPAGDKIAFLNSKNTLFIMDWDGENIQQVTYPDRGKVTNYAFSSDGKYIYFTRISMADFAMLTQGEDRRDYPVRFERYSVAENKVQVLFQKQITMALGGTEDISGIFPDVANNRIYYDETINAGDAPSEAGIRVSVLELGPPASEQIVLPSTQKRQGTTIQSTGYKLMSVSCDGRYLLCARAEVTVDEPIKTPETNAPSDSTQGKAKSSSSPQSSETEATAPESGKESTPMLNPDEQIQAPHVKDSESIVIRAADGSSETAVQGVPSADVKVFEFSKTDPTLYYLGVSTGSDESGMTIQMYEGRVGRPGLTPTGLTIKGWADASQEAEPMWQPLPPPK